MHVWRGQVTRPQDLCSLAVTPGKLLLTPPHRQHKCSLLWSISSWANFQQKSVMLLTWSDCRLPIQETSANWVGKMTIFIRVVRCRKGGKSLIPIPGGKKKQQTNRTAAFCTAQKYMCGCMHTHSQSKMTFSFPLNTTANGNGIPASLQCLTVMLSHCPDLPPVHATCCLWPRNSINRSFYLEPPT